MEWYLKVLRNYANFEGRARRKEYWMFALVHVIIVIILYSIMIAGATSDSPTLAALGVGLVALYGLGVFIPGLAVAVRRLHDVGKSGWMLLIYLVPLIGGIWLLVLLTTDSIPGPNQFGANPKETISLDTDTDHLVEV